jgi:hypothetical protein
MPVIFALPIQRNLAIAGMSRNDLVPPPSGLEPMEDHLVVLMIPRASINLQPKSDSRTLSSSQSTV